MALTFSLNPAWLPFITTFMFVFAIIYALLLKAKVIEYKNANIIIAAAIALFASLYQPLVDALQVFLPIAAIILVILFFIVFVKSLIGGDEDSIPLLAVLVIALLLLGVFWGNIIALFPMPLWLASDAIIWIIGIVIILLIFLVVYKHK